jgi:hypothetical protein
MAKLKKAPGRLIGRWKQEALAANQGASDEELARVINDRAMKEGYDYKITPDKVWARSKKAKRRKPARRPVPTSAARVTAPPAPKAVPTGGISLEDVRALKGLVDRIGADKVQELAGMLAR